VGQFESKSKRFPQYDHQSDNSSILGLHWMGWWLEQGLRFTLHPPAEEARRIVRGLVKRLFGQKNRAAQRRDALPQLLRLPVMPPLTYAVGDIHGCLDLYRKLEAQIVAEAAGTPVLIVLVGDLIDRGPDSAGVIRHIMGRAPEGVQRLTLMGNHEQMMLQFLDAPRANIRWLDYGGRTTLESYSVKEAQLGGFDLPEAQLAQKMRALLPSEDIAWMRSLPAAILLGDRYFLSHSGINPSKPLGAQTAQDLMWSRGMKGPPPDGITVIHGHTPVEVVDVTARYIDIDTGAYATGRLSAVRLSPGSSPHLLQVS